jgi:hypothetical protein
MEVRRREWRSGRTDEGYGSAAEAGSGCVAAAGSGCVAAAKSGRAAGTGHAAAGAGVQP